MKHNVSLSTMQARTIIAVIENTTLSDCNAIETESKRIVNELSEKYENVFPVAMYENFLSFTISKMYQKAYKDKIIDLRTFVASFAEKKQSNYDSLQDFGYFGDLLELLVRIMLIGNLNLVQYSALGVAMFGKTDIISAKYGKVEVGHNGKTFTEGTLFDYMAGNYDCLVYGMFSDIDKAEIIRLCKAKNLEKAITETKKRIAIWKNKNDFPKDINSLGHKDKTVKALTVKSGKIMMQ